MAKKAATKAVAKKDELELTEGTLSSHSLAQVADYDMAVFDNVALDVADDHELFSNDIVVPKIWLIQAMSDLRKAKKADEGDFVDSRSEEILLAESDSQEYLPFVVMKTFKRWQTFKLNGDKKEFVNSEIMTLDNAKYEYEFTENGDDFIRRQVISAYVLLGQDVQKGVSKPYIIDFAATSKGAGRDLVSDIKVLNTEKRNPKTGDLIRRGLPSWVGWFKLSCHEVSGEHDYFVKDVSFGGMLSQDVLPFLRDAYDEITSLIEANAIEIDDRDLHDAAKSEQPKENVAEDAAMTEARI